jgi:hypothetical protein
MKEVDTLIPKKPRRVKYQERDEDARWRRFHVTFTMYEYEYFLDQRKIYKLSVSHILAIAVKKYLKQEIFEMMQPKNRPTTDNNRFFSYTLRGKMVGGVARWTFFWGMPEDPLLLLR